MIISASCRIAPPGARKAQLTPVRPKWEHQREQAEFLAQSYNADTLALAWRIAMQREATNHDKFNLGHLK